MKAFKTMTLAGLLALVMIMIVHTPLWAQNQDMHGWEADGAYNQHYDMAEFDTFKAKIVDFKEVVPMPGMSPAVAMVVKDQDDEEILVHLGPKWFVRNHGLRKGDKVRIRGAWAELDGQDVFMAAKIKRGEDFSYKVRLSKDGTPFWTLTPEQLAQEKGTY